MMPLTSDVRSGAAAGALPATLSLRHVSMLLGIIGHRSLAPEDEQHLRDALAPLLSDVSGQVPSTSVVVLTPLSPGAELLAAEVALDAGLSVIACLPMASVEYEHEFPDAQRLRSVLARCSAQLVVPRGEGVDCYDNARRYVAFYSHVLVALWDGISAEHASGTGEVVNLSATGSVGTGLDADRVVRYGSQPTPIFQVVTPRSTGKRPDDAFALQKRYPKRYSGDTRSQTDFEAALGLLDRYNEDLGSASADPQDAYDLRSLWSRTDATATSLQRRALAQLRLLYGVGLVTIAVQLGFGKLLAPEALKVATLAIAFVTYRAVRGKDLENRYQDYRALSEGLRVQTAWNAGGLARELVDAYYLRMQQSELQWIRMALRSASFTERAIHAPLVDDRLASNWVREQWRYYHRAAARDQRRAQRYKRIGQASQALAVGALLVAVAFLLPSARSIPGGFTTGFEQSITAVAAMVGAISALLASYAEKRGFSANAKRYERIFGVFDRALRGLHRVAQSNHDERADILHEVGRDALAEHAEWLLERRDRPLRAVSR